MPTPIAHGLAGACVAVLASRRLPAARALPVVAALLFAANIPDIDYLAVVGGRETMEAFHQGPCHSIGFVVAASAALAPLMRRRLGFSRAWLLLAATALTHLLLDLMVFDRTPPLGFACFWPFSTVCFHAPLEIFPGIDRANVFSALNLREVLVELAWGVPALLATGWRPHRRGGKHGNEGR